jgi:sulfate transport system permease protein
VGEYGSVIFISGNLRMKTQIAPYLIVTELAGNRDDADAAATAIAVVMLVTSLLMLLAVNLLERRTTRRS